jgi:serine/threonine protein kinase
MSSNIWQTDYKQLSILGSNDYKTVYKAKSIKSKKLVSIKEFSINSDKEMLIYGLYVVENLVKMFLKCYFCKLKLAK